MKPNVISFHYTVKNKTGAVLESSNGGEPMQFVEGSGGIIPGLEQALTGSKEGDKKNVALTPAEAYGDYDDSLIAVMDRTEFPEDEIEVGDQFRVKGDDDNARIFTVTKISDEEVTMDGNHPLAGQELFFDVEVTGVREATDADLMPQDDHCCEEHHPGHSH